MHAPFRRARQALGLASISLFGAEGGAWAQQPAGPAPPTLPEVRVREFDDGFKTDATKAVTGTETPLRDIPQFVNILSQELLRSQNATTLVDALRNVPGISYAAAEGGTQANQVVYLRGFPLNADIFVDGVRDLGEYNRDLFATDSVEVLKGSSALLFGRGSPGGLINQTFKRAYRVNASQVDATVGSFGQKRIVGDSNVRLGANGAVRLIAMAEHSGSYRYPQDVEKYGFAPSFLWDVGPTTQLTGAWYWFKARDVTDYGQPTLFSASQGFFGFPDVSPRKYYGYENYDYAHYETNIADLRVDHQLSGTFSVNGTLRYARYERRSESTIPSLAALDANGHPVTRDTPRDLLLVNRNHDTGRTKDNDDDALIGQAELSWKRVTGTVRHVVLAGLELARERIDRVNHALDANPDVTGVQTPTSQTPFLNPDPSTSLGYTKTPNLRGVAEAKTIALYAQDQIALTPRWKALVGVRWERYASDARNEARSASATASGPFARTDRMLSGRAGLIWQPTGTQSYYLAWGNAYNPSGELGVYGGTASTNLNPANEAVGPEKSQNAEIGAQWDVGALQVRSALFRNEKTNQRIVDDTGATVLAGKRRIDGLEIEVSGLITSNWELYGGIAFMDGRITHGTPVTTGRIPLGVAEVQGSVWTVYKLGGGWEVGGGLRGQKGTWLTDANVPGSQIPGYVLVDAMVAYVAPTWEMRLNGYNLGDKTYYLGGYNNSPSRVIPGQPVYGNVTVTYRF